MTTLEDLIQAALTAPPERKEAALRVLRGDPPAPAAEVAPPAAEPFLTLKEIARRLNLNPCTLWRWRVPGHDLGGRPRFRLSEVTAYLQSDAMQRRVMALRAQRRPARAAALPLNLATATPGLAVARSRKPGRQRN